MYELLVTFDSDLTHTEPLGFNRLYVETETLDYVVDNMGNKLVVFDEYYIDDDSIFYITHWDFNTHPYDQT